MAVRDILRMGHPTLRKKSEPVGIHDVSSSKIQNLITDRSLDKLCLHYREA